MVNDPCRGGRLAEGVQLFGISDVLMMQEGLSGVYLRAKLAGIENRVGLGVIVGVKMINLTCN